MKRSKTCPLRSFAHALTIHLSHPSLVFKSAPGTVFGSGKETVSPQPPPSMEILMTERISIGLSLLLELIYAFCIYGLIYFLQPTLQMRLLLLSIFCKWGHRGTQRIMCLHSGDIWLHSAHFHPQPSFGSLCVKEETSALA